MRPSQPLHPILHLPALAAGCLALGSSALAAPTVDAFLETHCFECHDDLTTKGELDLTQLDWNPANPTNLATWIHLHDRVDHREMPPPDEARQPSTDEIAAFTAALGDRLTGYFEARQSERGRAIARRLTRVEYERTLHDLLGVRVPLQDLLPEDPGLGGFDRVAEGQPLSPVLLERYLEAADAALTTAFDLAGRKPRKPPTRLVSRDQLLVDSPWFYGGPPDPRDEFAVVWNFYTHHKGGGKFYGRLPKTRVGHPGYYRVTIRAKAFHPPNGRVWAAVHRGHCDTGQPQLKWVDWIDAGPETTEFVVHTRLEKGEMLHIRPVDRTTSYRGRRRIEDKLVMHSGRTPESEQVPGIGIESIRLERLTDGLSPGQIRQRLFGSDAIVSDGDKTTLIAQLRRFAGRAFRRPVSAQEVESYATIAQEQMEAGATYPEALQAGFLAILCSPRFLFFEEPLGRLDDHALATRLSYFLWGSAPDPRLRQLARQGRLSDPDTLRTETDRLLDHPRSAAFIEDFTNQWLNLDEIDFTVPDYDLYPEFDQILKHSMLGETRAFFRRLIDDDLSASNLIDSDFAMLNGRLAKHYGFGKSLNRLDFQPVPVPPGSPRGGLITQGSVLKVTANGTTTSPVLRGVWMLERILGEHVPPPPTNVPAVEPDIRGSVSIREQLEKHSEAESCSGCHAKIDPPGYALESFDVIGGWRIAYRKLDDSKRRATWKSGPPVDPSAKTYHGDRFEDIQSYKGIVLKKPENIARNLTTKLATYATGAEVSFADRPAIDKIITATAPHHGVRSLIHGLVQSPLFQSK